MTYEEPLIAIGPMTTWAFLLTIGVLLVILAAGRHMSRTATDVLFGVAATGTFLTFVLLALGAP